MTLFNAKPSTAAYYAAATNADAVNAATNAAAYVANVASTNAATAYATEAANWAEQRLSLYGPLYQILLSLLVNTRKVL